MASAVRTTDHETIRQSVARGGHPAHVVCGSSEWDPCIVRISYSGHSGTQSLERLDLDAWLDAFEENSLALLHLDEADSRFSKLVRRAPGDERAQGSRTGEAFGARETPRGSRPELGLRRGAGRFRGAFVGPPPARSASTGKPRAG